MGRKKKTDGGGESSESQDVGGRGSQRSAERRDGPQQHGGSGYHGGRGWASQGGRGGQGGGRGRGTSQHQHYGGPPDYQGRGRGGPYQHGGRGNYGGNRSGMGGGGIGGGSSSGGPSRPPVPELHQATPVYQGGVTQPMSSLASSSSHPPDTSSIDQQFQQISIQQESSQSQAIQPAPPSSKSMRFPLRPGMGSSGIRCIVKANHFFAELPDKDLHQYDVGILFCSAAHIFSILLLVFFFIF